jgi:hypothetical protein
VSDSLVRDFVEIAPHLAIGDLRWRNRRRLLQRLKSGDLPGIKPSRSLSHGDPITRGNRVFSRDRHPTRNQSLSVRRSVSLLPDLDRGNRPDRVESFRSREFFTMVWNLRDRLESRRSGRISSIASIYAAPAALKYRERKPLLGH